MKTARKQVMFSWCLCAVCGKERCLWHPPLQPLASKVASPGNSLLEPSEEMAAETAGLAAPL